MLPKLPLEILVHIADHLPHPKSALALACLSRSMNLQLAKHVAYWEAAWNAYLSVTMDSKYKVMWLRGISFHDRLRLLGVQECMLCGYNGTNLEVKWALGVRCCYSCLADNLVDTDDLIKLGIKEDEIEHLPYEIQDDYHSGIDETFSYIVYFKPHLAKFVRTTRGV